jgi:hypothetical protein
MSRAHTFRVGQRVEMTAKAREQGLVWRRHDRGVVVGLGNPEHNLSVIVKRDGLKRPTSYHVSFWRKEPR